MKTKKKEILKEYGLLEDTLFENYFQIENSLQGTIITPVKKGIGLQRLKQYRKETETKIISNFTELTNQDMMNLPFGAMVGTNEKAETRKIGYVFVTGGIPNCAMHPSLIPICGKLGKDGTTFVSHIKELEKMDGHTYIQMSEDDKTLIALAGNLTEENANSYLKTLGLSYEDSQIHDNEMQKFYLEQLKQITPLLENHPSIYIYQPNYIFGHIEITKHNLTEIKVSSVSVSLSFRLYEKDKMIVLHAQYQLGENVIDIEPAVPYQNYPFLFTIINGTYHLNNSVGESQSLSLFKKNPIMKVVKSDFDNFYEDVVKPIAQKFPIDIKKISEIKNIAVKLVPKEKQLYISEIGNFILFKPFIKYDKKISTPDVSEALPEKDVNNKCIVTTIPSEEVKLSQPEKQENEMLVEVLNGANIIEKKNNTIFTYERDLQYEQDFIVYLKTLHPQFANQFRNDFFHLSVEKMLSDNWFFNAFSKLRESDITVFGYNKLKSFKYSPYQAKITVQLSSGEDWFDVNVQVTYGDFNVDLKDIQKAVLRNEQYIKLADGTTGILPDEWFEKFKKYFQHGEVSGNKVQISKLRFSIIDELFENIDDMEIIKELEEKKQRMLSFKEIKSVKIPDNITAQLRDYQKEGLNWLNFLHEFRWGGILADDMGLGKTLQALTFLTTLLKKSKKANLIVVPTSLMFNWENEIKKFAPDLSAMFYHGSDRIKDHSSFKKYNLIFTTYGLMARDIEILKEYKFHYIILDESQAIKNPLSQRYKAACLLRASNRLALTGTPIENNTFDLFAQMTFLNPGFLGNITSFKEKYSVPIDRDRNEQCAQELQKLINPFIIRRTKEQVEKDLPEKTEDILYCTMETEQQKVYDAFRNKYRNYLLNKIAEEGLAKSKIYVLEGLLKLRQICDSPELLSDEEKYSNESVKIQELLRHINQKTGKHKLLVFSQFVKMLQLIKKQLDDNGTSYEYLDGQNSIKQRQNSVSHFQSDEKCRVFLISLKAGGLGINLTAADYVYIIDPWWNPAVENQAIDRCHRIGQNKKVIAYRMICKNTVEEKILNLQAKKKQIASDIIQTDESFMKAITKSDIEQLFE
ncbi:MAG: SNF2-related protein [Bacteroidota bacterium]